MLWIFSSIHIINMCGPSGTLSVASKFVVLTVLIGITLFMTLISTIVLASHLDGHPTNTSKIIIIILFLILVLFNVSNSFS